MCTGAASIGYIVHGNNRPHVTREKAVSCQITFKLYRFFLQFVANSSKASLSCYIYCDLWQLMVILRIVYVIHCDFAIVCYIYCDSVYGNFATISSFSHDFAFYRVFPSDMGPHCRQKKNIFPLVSKTPPHILDRQKRYLFSIFSDVEDHLEQTKSIKMSKITPSPPD